MKKYIFYAIFTASIIANIIFFLSDGILYLKYTIFWSKQNIAGIYAETTYRQIEYSVKIATLRIKN